MTKHSTITEFGFHHLNLVPWLNQIRVVFARKRGEEIATGLAANCVRSAEPLTSGTFPGFVMQGDVNVPGLYPTPSAFQWI